MRSASNVADRSAAAIDGSGENAFASPLAVMPNACRPLPDAQLRSRRPSTRARRASIDTSREPAVERLSRARTPETQTELVVTARRLIDRPDLIKHGSRRIPRTTGSRCRSSADRHPRTPRQQTGCGDRVSSLCSSQDPSPRNLLSSHRERQHDERKATKLATLARPTTRVVTAGTRHPRRADARGSDCADLYIRGLGRTIATRNRG